VKLPHIATALIKKLSTKEVTKSEEKLILKQQFTPKKDNIKSRFQYNSLVPERISRNKDVFSQNSISNIKYPKSPVHEKSETSLGKTTEISLK